MRRNSYTIAASLAILITACQANADFTPSKWQFSKAIHGQAGGKLTYVSLDKDVLLNSSLGFEDLRVVDGNGKETPFKLVDDREQPEAKSISVAPTNVSSLPGKYRSMTLNLAGGGHSNRLSIITPDKNFTCRVQVAARYGSGPWEILKNDAYIFDFSHEGNARRMVAVTYPETDARSLRVRIFADRGRVIRADSATVELNKSATRRATVLYDGKGTATQNQKNKSTEILLTLGGVDLPAGTVKLFSPAMNYQRRVDVEASSDGKTWSYLGNGYILKYKTDRLHEDISDIRFEGGNYNRIRLTIHNADNEPIPLSRVFVETPERKLAFIPKERSTYKLYYGNTQASVPVYDIQGLYGYISGMPKSVSLTLGAQERNPSYVPPAEPGPHIVGPWLMWVSVAAAMVVLIVLLVNLGKKIKAAAPPRS